MKQTRITSKPDGDVPLVEVEAIAIRKEAYFATEATTKTPYDDVTITVTSGYVCTTHRIYGATGDYGGWKNSPSVACFLPLPLQEDEKFDQQLRDLMVVMVDVHISQIKQMGEVLPEAKQRGQLKLTTFSTVCE